MKIAINCIFCQPRGGGVREYIYNVVSALSQIDTENEYILYVLKDCVEYARQVLPHVDNMRIQPTPYDSSYKSVILRSLFSNRYWLAEEKKEQFDIFHSPFFHAPRLKRSKVIITVHDLRFCRYPSTYTLPRYLFLRTAVMRSIQQADKIISISEFTKQEIMDVYKIGCEKIKVVNEAINREDFSIRQLDGYVLDDVAKPLEGSRFMLSVGHIEPRKNYGRLLDAFATLKEKTETNDVKLVIVGKKGHHYKEILRRMGKMSDVYYLDFVSRELLLWLYQHAALFVFPSFYEGFGFPPLEAACFGIISAVSNASSIPEVCGESAAYFNPFSVEDMANTLWRCLSDEAFVNEKKTLLMPNLDRFSWEKNACETLQTYHSL